MNNETASEPTLAIGPANYAGQAYAWAEAVNHNLSAHAWSFSPQRFRAGFQFQTHRRLTAVSYYAPIWKNARTKRFTRNASHLLIDGFRPIFYNRSGFYDQARYLLAHGPKLGLISHGTDIRDPETHLQRNKFSYFSEGDSQWLSRTRKIAAANRAFARQLGVPVFVSTPDLLFDLPEATWLPVCIDVSAWTTDRPILLTDRPKVLFIPSQRNPPIKGTRYIDPVLRRLHDQGVIEYLAPVSVPHAQMIELVHSVDVVVDQLLFGSYGVAAVEAMAAGRVVIGNISSLTPTQLPERPRIVEATPTDLEQVIHTLLERRAELIADAATNRSFVKRWHDGKEAARRIADFLHF